MNERVAPGHGLDPLLGSRTESWRWDMLTNRGGPLGTLDGVEDGSLEMSIFNTIRSGGNLTYAGPDPVDWNRVRLQPWITVGSPVGELSWPMGVYIPATPAAGHDDVGTTYEVELYDKLLVLEQDKVDKSHAVPAGATVTAAIRALILGAGETMVAITDSTEKLRSPMVWEAGTSKLAIINELLEVINYFSLWCDGFGAYRAEPYVDPDRRPIERTLRDDEAGLYLPKFTHTEDTFNIPNKVVLVSQSDGDTPALVAVATNTDPNSPFSYPSRGRWVTFSETGVETTSQAVFNAVASRRLSSLASVSSTFDIEHAMIPLDLNDAVRFIREARNISGVAVVQKMSISTTPGSLVKTTLRTVSA